jgi:hypothetical protein
VFSTLSPVAILPEALSGDTERVSIATAQDWCASRGLTQIDLLKVDAEGHDLCVLRGAASMFECQKINAVLVEIHLGPGSNTKLEDVQSWLQQYDYVLCGIYDQQGSSANKLFWGNFLFLPSRMLSQ